MPCYSPLTGYVSREPSKNGKFPIVFDPKKGWIDRRVTVPCGQCIGCLLERSRQWAMRCLHEASLYDENCFITLTYDDQHLPPDGCLNKKHFQKFMKRLRKRFGSGVRYFHCGEYGEQNCRPHYHACLFNFRFPDCRWMDMPGRSADLPPLYFSETLFELWPYGLHAIGDVTFDSAAYVARYCLKKLDGLSREEKYLSMVAPDLDERVREYTTMSRRPGIGREWYERYKSECFPSDEVVIRGGVVCKPPRYYDNVFTGEDPVTMAFIKGRRQKDAVNNPDNSGPRLLVRNEVEKAKRKLFLKRRIEK